MAKTDVVLKVLLFLTLLGKLASTNLPPSVAANLNPPGKTEADATLAQGEAYEGKKQFKEATDSYMQVAHLSPSKHVKLASQLGLVRCYLELGDQKKALAGATGLLNQRPPVDADTRCILYLLRGNCYKRSEQWQSAIDDFQQAVNCPATKEAALYGMAESYHGLKRFRLALTRISEVTWMNPNNAGAFKLRGTWWYQLAKYGEARADYSMVLKLGRNEAEVYARRGDCNRQMGDKEAALDDCAQAIRINPADPIGFKIRARVYYDIGDDEGALADLNKAIALSPRDRKLYMQRAAVYDDMKETALAAQDREFAKSLSH
jgi:tetratricopeptide (TPR) repeat protein